MDTTATVAVLFCDTVGSTERLTRLGDVAGDAFRRRLFDVLRSCIDQTRGTEVKNLGDGLMVVFERSTIDALICAALMHERAAGVEPADPVHLRIGISVGEVAHEDGDWFGTPVVEAARLCGVARSDQTLAPALVATLVGSRAAEHRFRAVGDISLKGLAGPMAVVEVDGPDADVPEPAPPPDGTTAVAAGAEERPGRRRLVLAAAVLALVAVAGGAVWALGRGEGSTGPEVAADVEVDRAGGEDAVTEPDGYRPRLEARTCDPEVLDSAPAATCSDLVVPEDRERPDGRMIRLAVTSVDGPDGGSAPPVLLLDVNEPVGGSSLVDGADVHALSLRGFQAGADPPMTCPELSAAWRETFRQRADDPSAVAARSDAAGACANRLRAAGVHIESYTMAEAADDLRDLAVALGLDGVTVAASGYTTTAAAAFARTDPGRVASLVLTNPTPPGESPLAEPAASLSRSFGALVDLCEADAGCAATFPDLPARYEQRQSEFEASPRLVSTRALDGSGPYEVLLDGRRFGAAVESVLRSSDRVGLVPSAVDTASDELIAAASVNEEIGFFVGPAALAAPALSYFCSHDAELNRASEITDAAVRAFAGANEPSLVEMCTAWGVPSVYRRLSQPLDLDVPVLLAEGGLTVGGVSGWSESMADLLPRARVVHLATMSDDLSFTPPPCLRRVRAAFVADAERELDLEACAEQTPPVEFSGVG